MVMDRFFIVLILFPVLLSFGNVRSSPVERPYNFKVIAEQELINYLHPFKSETGINKY